MPQNTNLNVTPYYDDFDKNKNFYKVLFPSWFPDSGEGTNVNAIDPAESDREHGYEPVQGWCNDHPWSGWL